MGKSVKRDFRFDYSDEHGGVAGPLNIGFAFELRVRHPFVRRDKQLKNVILTARETRYLSLGSHAEWSKRLSANVVGARAKMSEKVVRHEFRFVEN